MPLLLGLESFSPSVLISVGTRAEVSTFGRVTKFGDTQSRPWNLRTRTRPSISISNRYLNPVTPVKSKQVNKRVADILVRLFFSDSLAIHCGGKVVRGFNIQICVAPATSYLVSSHATKAEAFEGNRLYIMTPSKSGRVTVYLDLSISTEYMSKETVKFLIAQEFPVKFWSIFLPRAVSCTVQEIEELIMSLDGSSKRLVEFITPKKKLKVDPSLSNLAFSFTVDVFG